MGTFLEIKLTQCEQTIQNNNSYMSRTVHKKYEHPSLGLTSFIQSNYVTVTEIGLARDFLLYIY